MPKSPTTVGCSLAQLRSLLELGLDVQEASHSVGLISRLKIRLAVMGEVEGRRADALLDEALDGKTSLDALQRIKEASKRLDERSTTAEEREAARLVYHIALAAALATHGKLLSRRRADEQVKVYSELAEISGDEKISEIMQRAIEKIQERSRRQI